jgi:hypothetical protein
MLLKRQLRPEAYGRRRGGYLDRRRAPTADTRVPSATFDDLRDHNLNRPCASSPSCLSWTAGNLRFL